MSDGFRSDVSFPEPSPWNGQDDRPMPSQKRPQKGPMRAQMRELDYHELWAVVRTFRHIYGEAKLRELIEDACAATEDR